MSDTAVLPPGAPSPLPSARASSSLDTAQARSHPAGSRPTVELVIPVHCEERQLAPSVRRLHGYLEATFPFTWRITIVDNASTDRTWDVARTLVDELPGVAALHLDAKGRGRAVRAAWSLSRADVVAYMDVDLSTDLGALLPLVAPLLSGHSDVAIGSRLAHGAQVVRGPRREVISRAYNLLLHATLRSRFSDAQCGFKALRADVAQDLLPLVHDEAWFFDTELLVLAERNGLRIHEVPVDWVDDLDSRVDVLATAAADLAGIRRMAGRLRHDDGWRLPGTTPAPRRGLRRWRRTDRAGPLGRRGRTGRGRRPAAPRRRHRAVSPFRRRRADAVPVAADRRVPSTSAPAPSPLPAAAPKVSA